MRKHLIIFPFLAPILAGVASLILAGCSSGPLSVHKIEIQQGNALKFEAVEKLEVGMNEQQVRYLLGNPLITDGFHANRWDYVYYLKNGGDPVERRRLTLFFEGDQVIRIERPDANQRADSG